MTAIRLAIGMDLVKAAGLRGVTGVSKTAKESRKGEATDGRAAASYLIREGQSVCVAQVVVEIIAEAADLWAFAGYWTGLTK